MKLFIDTSNKKLILAAINQDNNVVDFLMKDTDNNIVKNSIPELEAFLNKNGMTLNNIEEFMMTIGPGSFTGVKVALNIINTVSLIREVNKIKTIDSFKLIEQDKYDGTVIPFGKSKYYFKKKKKSKISVINDEQFKKLVNVTAGYDNFTKEILQQKIDDKAFKIVDNLDKVKIKYLSAF